MKLGLKIWSIGWVLGLSLSDLGEQAIVDHGDSDS